MDDFRTEAHPFTATVTMKSTAAKLSALIVVTDWGYGTYGVWFGAPRTYTGVSNYTEGTMILDLVDTRTSKLVFRGTGEAVTGGAESNAGKIRDAVKKRVARPSERSDARSSASWRVSVCHISQKIFVHRAFSEIRFHGAENMQIARRLRAMIVNLANTLPARHHPALDQELNLLDR